MKKNRLKNNREESNQDNKFLVIQRNNISEVIQARLQSKAKKNGISQRYLIPYHQECTFPMAQNFHPHTCLNCNMRYYYFKIYKMSAYKYEFWRSCELHTFKAFSTNILTHNASHNQIQYQKLWVIIEDKWQNLTQVNHKNDSIR